MTTGADRDEHPPLDELALLDIDPGPDADQLTAHVAACSTCRADLDLVRGLATRLAALPPAPLPAAIADRLDGALAALPAPAATRRRDRARRRLAVVSAAAAVVAVVAGIALLPNHTGSGNNPKRDSRPSGLAANGAAPRNVFTPQTLPDQARSLVAAATTGQSHLAPRATPEPQADQAAQDLAGCLTAVGAPRGTPLGTSQGTFQGKPVRLVVLPSSTGRADVLLVGPDCAAGRPDLRYRRDGVTLR